MIVGIQKRMRLQEDITMEMIKGCVRFSCIQFENIRMPLYVESVDSPMVKTFTIETEGHGQNSRFVQSLFCDSVRTNSPLLRLVDQKRRPHTDTLQRWQLGKVSRKGQAQRKKTCSNFKGHSLKQNIKQNNNKTTKGMSPQKRKKHVMRHAQRQTPHQYREFCFLYFKVYTTKFIVQMILYMIFCKLNGIQANFI